MAHPYSTYLAGLTLGFILACGGLSEPAPDLASPQHWDDLGIQFDYPGNWTSTPEASAGFTTVTVESPGNALILVQLYPEGIEFELDEVAPIFMTEMQNVMADMGGVVGMDSEPLSPVTRPIAGATRHGRHGGFTLELFGVQVPHNLDIYSLPGDAPILIIVQIPEEDLTVATPGLNLVLDSFQRKTEK